MAGSFCDFLEDAVLNYVFGVTAFTPAATMYVGLSTTTIADAGTNITEPAAGSYARVAITNNKTTWTTSSTGALDNAIAITFPAATASWGVITDFFISSAASDGNIYIYGVLTASKTVDSGDTVQFAIGALDITLG